MDNLIKLLRRNTYDYINGFRSNYSLKQIWEKDPHSDRFSDIYEDCDYLFKSSVQLNVHNSSNMNIYAEAARELKFNIGLSVIKSLFKRLNLHDLKLEHYVKNGTTVKYSFNSIREQQIYKGNLENYFDQADFVHENSGFIEKLHKGYLYIIAGILTAKEIVIEIEGGSNFELNFPEEIKKIVNLNIEVSGKTTKKLKLKYKGDKYFPFAVKAYRIKWDENEFNKLVLVTDTRNFF